MIYLKDYKLESILGPLFKLLEASFELFVPLVMASIIDVGIANGDKAYILKMCGILILLAIIGLTCSLTAQYFAAKAAVGVSAKLRYALFAHIQEMSYATLDQAGIPTLITRLTSDINQIQSGLNLTLRLLLRSPFIVLGAMVMAFSIDVRASLAFAVAIPLLSVVIVAIMGTSIPLYQKAQSGLDGVLAATRENLAGSRVIRAFHLEDEEIGAFQEKNRALTALQLHVGRISALMNPVTYVIVNLAIVAIIWQGGVRVWEGNLSQGEVVALVNYMSQILVELIKFANLVVTVNRAVACAKRVGAVLATEGGMADGTVAFPGSQAACAVRFEDVSMRYPGSSETAISHITLDAKPGQTIGIIGGTGAGKSTVANLIPRFYDVSEGRVLVSGTDVREYQKESLRGHIGIVPQKAVLFSGTIRENMQWGKNDATDEEIWEALAIAQAADFVKEKPGGLDYQIEQGGRNLSGGQRQRLTIARAIIKKPGILILDDSSSALDYATDAALRAALRSMQERPTVFLVSQRASTLMHADQILVLDDGQAVGLGNHEALLKDCEVYREIYEVGSRPAQ